jgi:SAM-dependent methyltransferase
MTNRKVSNLKNKGAQEFKKLAESSSHSKANKRPQKRASRDMLSYLFSPETVELLEDIPLKVIRDTWIMSSHLLLKDGADVQEVGCRYGEAAYALSVLKPQWNVTAIDSCEKSIKRAKNTYSRPNLSFACQDIINTASKEESFDAIINSFVLHEIYSDTKYNMNSVEEALEIQYKSLKKDGFMYIQDYTAPKDDDYILMEFKNDPSKGERVEDLSEADLLTWFSENARTGEALRTGGFYLEELPARFPNTRLFRLPHKWACEFVLRKGNRTIMEEDLDTEYTFATQKELRQEIRAFGGRLVYTSSNWDDDFIKKNVIGKFKLYTEKEEPINYPATSYTMLVQRVEKEESLRYQEWRTSRAKPTSLTIQSMRHNQTGKIIDIASRHLDLTDVIPFYEDEKGNLKVFLQENAPRSIINSVPRHGTNINGRSWSGHMIEALPFNTKDIQDLEESSKKKAIHQFATDMLDVNTDTGIDFIEGPMLYPDTNSIDEAIETRYLRTYPNKNRKPLTQTKYTQPEGTPFNTVGRLKEFNAQDIINGCSVGFIPNASLEIQILKLFAILGKRPIKWSECPVILTEMDVKERFKVKDYLAEIAKDKKRFSPIKAPPSDLRAIHSVFLEEGHDDQGGLTDMSAKEQDFFIPQDDTENVAVVMPLAHDKRGEIMMGIIKEHAPVPERFEGNGTTINVPSFSIPKHITDMEGAKRYVASVFQVDPKFVGKLGEPYFQHAGMTPKRIFPFIVTNLKGKMDYRHATFTDMAPLSDIYVITGKKVTKGGPVEFMKTLGEVYHFLGQDHDLAMKYDFDTSLFDKQTQQSFHDSDFTTWSSQSSSNTSVDKESEKPAARVEKKPQVS